MANFKLETLRPVSPRAASPDSEVRVDTGNGHGSPNVTIRRFSNTTSSTGSAITFTDSASDGSLFTINEDGVYAITYTDQRASAASNMGISLNSSQLGTNIASINTADRLVHASTGTAGAFQEVSITVRLSAGDEIRAHTDGNVDATISRVQFHITQLYKLDMPVNTLVEDNLKLSGEGTLGTISISGGTWSADSQYYRWHRSGKKVDFWFRVESASPTASTPNFTFDLPSDAPTPVGFSSQGNSEWAGSGTGAVTTSLTGGVQEECASILYVGGAGQWQFYSYIPVAVGARTWHGHFTYWTDDFEDQDSLVGFSDGNPLKAGLLKKNRWQRKNLTSVVATATDSLLDPLEFSGLTVGNQYVLIPQPYSYIGQSGLNNYAIEWSHDGTVIASVQSYRDNSVGQLLKDNYVPFTATATTITCAFASSNGTFQLYGSPSAPLNSFGALLREINTDEETSAW